MLCCVSFLGKANQTSDIKGKQPVKIPRSGNEKMKLGIAFYTVLKVKAYAMLCVFLGANKPNTNKICVKPYRGLSLNVYTN